MVSSILVFSFAFLAGLWFLLSLKSKHSKSGLRQPPGPWGLPIVGHLHMLGDLPHQSLQKLSKRYGPIMHIRLGQVSSFVASSSEWAELLFKTHDSIFSGRPNLEASKWIGYDRKGIVFAQYGPYWRSLRKLCNFHLLSNSKIEMFKPMRKQEVSHFIEEIKLASQCGSSIDITAMAETVVENMTYLMIFGFKDDRFNLKSSIHETMALYGTFNLSDYIPFLRILDIQGYRRRMRKVAKVLDGFLEMIINEHVQDAKNLQGQHRDFIDVVLSLQDEQLERDGIKSIMIDLLAAGMDTTAVAIEWTVAELLAHPRVMDLVQEELKNIVGLDRMVEETDMVKLVYLKMVVKESMRLHPVVPCIPRDSVDDISINGYFIPKKSRVMVNVWALGRDPAVWSSNAHEFYPERFENSTIDLLGRDFQFLPFGSGRRICAGAQLGLTMVELVVAQLVHCFHLELPNGMLPSELDMKEKFNLTLPRENHLVAIPTYRLHK